jgi:hypothetical protein
MKNPAMLIACACVSVVLLAGCQTDSEDKVTAATVLNKCKAIFYPAAYKKDIKRIKIEFQEIIFTKDATTNLKRFVHIHIEKPNKFKIILEDEKLSASGIAKSMMEVVGSGNNHTVKFDNIEPGYITDLEKNEINSLIDEVNYYQNFLSLTVDQDFLEKSLSEQMYYIDGKKCYKVDVITTKQLAFSIENKQTYYIDCETYKIIAIGWSDSSITDIKYKKFGDYFIPWSYIHKRYINSEPLRLMTRYYRMLNFEVNPKFKNVFLIDKDIKTLYQNFAI